MGSCSYKGGAVRRMACAGKGLGIFPRAVLGNPLPVWRCDGCGKIESGRRSVAELGERSQLKNRYVAMRHGQALFNAKRVAETSGRAENHLTKKGIQESKASLARFTKKNKGVVPDIIITSPFPRTQETAHITAEYFGIAPERIITDAAIAEIEIGVFDGRPVKEYHAYFSSYEEMFEKRPPEGKSLTDLRVRMTAFLRRIEEKYEGKTIFIISHEYAVWMLETALLGYDLAETVVAKKKKETII